MVHVKPSCMDLHKTLNAMQMWLNVVKVEPSYLNPTVSGYKIVLFYRNL